MEFTSNITGLCYLLEVLNVITYEIQLARRRTSPFQEKEEGLYLEGGRRLTVKVGERRGSSALPLIWSKLSQSIKHIFHPPYYNVTYIS